MDCRLKALCVWELGGNLGHVNNLAAICTQLQARGYEVSVALRSLEYVGDVFGDTAVRIFQAPIWTVPARRTRGPESIADILGSLGYEHASGLRSLVRAWESIFELVSPDVVVFDFAPTALLAARKFSFKKIVTGIGFGELPPESPAVSLMPWRGQALQTVQSREAAIVDQINRVLSAGLLPPIRFIGDLYQVDRTIIAFIPELDLYGQRRNDVTYCLPSSGGKRYAAPSWKASELPKIFVYLKSSFRQTREVLEALSHISANVFVYLRGADEAAIKFCRAAGFSVSEVQVDLAEAMKSADYVIAHGGSTVLLALLAGKPVLCVPTQLEQMNMAHLLVRSRFGDAVHMGEQMQDAQKKLENLLHDKHIMQEVHALAQRYKDMSLKESDVEIADACDSLLGS